MSRLVARNKEIITLWGLGWKGSQIAKKLKISRSAVMGTIHRAREDGIDVPRRPHVPAEEKPPENVKRLTKAPSSALNPPPAPVAVEPIPADIKVAFTPPPPPPPKRGKPKKILELGAFDCRWIVSPGRYCGEHAVSARTPWCEEHYQIVYVPGTRKRGP